MEIVNTDAYEDMATTYQCLEIARLNEALKQHGIIDRKTREAICGGYIFDCGDFIDQGWFEVDGKRLYPELCFAERQPAPPDQIVGEIQTLHIQSEHFAFHEYAYGDIGWYFDEQNENADEIKTVSAGAED